ncbi:alpha/beta fold hydrolase [Klebsiella pneumoniae subsp. pneumoniae]|nr:alpha/beta fold hydrolase [Klebsiella pneumoniae subsp. pneumoniae]
MLSSTAARVRISTPAFLKSVVDQLGIDKVHLLGNSMGGHSAVAFTLSWPERVAKLVLMGGGPAV